MTGYRDDRDALRLEKERLAADLGDAERQLHEQQARAAEAERALAAQQAQLAANQAELMRLRQPPPASAPIDGAPVRCQQCGRENQSAHKFCLGCGAVLGQALVAPPMAAPIAYEPPQPNQRTPVIVVIVAFVVMFAAGAMLFLMANR